MSKKPRATGGRKAAAPPHANPNEQVLSVDLDGGDEPEIATRDPDIELGTPTVAPAEHLVDDAAVSIDLGPSHVRDAREAETETAAMAPAVLGPGISRIARMQRIRLWTLVAVGAAVLIGGVAWLIVLMNSGGRAGQPTARAVVEGRIVLDDAAGSKEHTEGERVIIPVGSVLEARGEDGDVAAVHLAGGWTFWLKPGTKIRIRAVDPDVELDLIHGSLGAQGTSAASWVIIHTPQSELRALRSRFAVRTASQTTVTVAEGSVMTRDIETKPITLESNQEYTWGPGAALQSATVEPDRSMGWLGRFPDTNWITLYRNDFLSKETSDLPADETHFEWRSGIDGPLLATRDPLAGSAVLLLGQPVKGDLRLSIRFRLQKAADPDAAIGLVFGSSGGKYYQLVFRPTPAPQLVLSLQGDSGWGSKVLAPVDEQSPILWRTLTVEIVGKKAAVSLNDASLGTVELDPYDGGRAGLVVANAQAQWKSIVLKEPARIEDLKPR